MMAKTVEINEIIAFEQDVTTMSYDELMASIRYLDNEREIIAKRFRGQSEKLQDNTSHKKESSKKEKK